MECEVCGEETDVIVECSCCESKICPSCEGAPEEDEAEEIICEECIT